MNELKLFNTLSRKKEEFKSLEKDLVKIYTCGPTVYNYAHIGNLRSYIFPDILRKVLEYLGYTVKHIINITDVGHLTSDADTGLDKVEKMASETGISAWDISKFYANKFITDIQLLNISLPTKFTYATEYIQEQIDLVKALEDKGFAYTTSDGLYYDTSKFSEYGKMARIDIDGLDEGLRVDIGEKKNKTDFALWKFSPKDQKRQMEWESPWGIGFPGWHIECSAMSISELGELIDIHTGGTDHIPVHHTNEIAQSEAYTGKKFVNYWLHGEFLVLDKNKKMGKSEGNFIGMNELVEEGFNPLAYRYLALTVHYRQFLTFSPDILKSAQSAYFNLKKQIKKAFQNEEFANDEKAKEFDNKILNALLDDLNVPKAIGLVWELVQDNSIGGKNKVEVIQKYDKIFSLNLLNFSDLPEEQSFEVPKEIIELAEKRLLARKNKDFQEADRLRNEIETNGFILRDKKDGFEIALKD